MTWCGPPGLAVGSAIDTAGRRAACAAAEAVPTCHMTPPAAASRDGLPRRATGRSRQSRASRPRHSSRRAAARGALCIIQGGSVFGASHHARAAVESVCFRPRLCAAGRATSLACSPVRKVEWRLTRFSRPNGCTCASSRRCCLLHDSRTDFDPTVRQLRARSDLRRRGHRPQTSRDLRL